MVPEVNWMLIGSSNCSSGASSFSRCAMLVAAEMGDLVEREACRGRLSPIWITERSAGSRAACSSPGWRDRQFRRQRVDHADIVAGLERASR